MSVKLADQFYLKALENFPYNYSEVYEALDKALLYMPNHPQANCLKGRLYMEIFFDFEYAEQFFEKAIKADLNYVETYKWFSLLKIWQGQYEQALKMIDYSLKVKGMDCATMLFRKQDIENSSLIKLRFNLIYSNFN